MTLGETPWADRTWGGIWDAVAAKVGEAWLPLTREAARLRVREYGAGHYGVVSPTRTPGVVVKLTSDPSEALFVSLALSLPEQPKGIVRYYGVFALSGHTYRKRKLWVLWRDEAHAIFEHVKDEETAWNAEPGSRTFEVVREKLIEKNVAVENVYVEAAEVRDTIIDARKHLSDAAYLAFLRDVWTDYQRPGTGQTRETRTLGRDLRTVKRLMGRVGDKWRMQDVGQAMVYYLDFGVLLCDVHHGNIGRASANGPFRITDPGHCLVVNPEIVIPPIEVL